MSSRKSPRFLVPHILKTGGETFESLLGLRFSRKEVIRQLYEFGNTSIGIVVLCITFVGIIIILEYSYHMRMVIGNDSLIPGFAMIMLARELAPAITALLITSKMGASIAAELGAMKTTEQLDAYRLLGLSPIDLFVTPRLIACAVATTLLSIVSLFVATIGAWLAAITLLNFGSGDFFNGLFLFAGVDDFILCAVKAFMFGASIPIISATLGFRCQFGAEGVGMATTDAVVANSIWIIILDFVLTFVYSAIVS
jgi:phospholipid/cholesterol/gamma-HCH transport system permease protein